MGVLLYGKSPLDAVQDPRLHHQLLPDVVVADADLPAEVIAGLRRRGHVVNTTGAFAVVQMVVHDLDSGNLTAVSDHGKGGAPAGY